jgi:hypothetical protein
MNKNRNCNVISITGPVCIIDNFYMIVYPELKLVNVKKLQKINKKEHESELKK